MAAEVTIPFNTAILGGETTIQLDRGKGHRESIAVKIPAGIDEGKKIRLRGQGQSAGANGPSGDLLLTIHVAPHPYFKRNGANLEVRLPVTLPEAIHGAKVEVPTPSGMVMLTIPKLTSSGQRLRVKGQGVRSKDGTAGDLFVEIQIKLPSSIDPAQLEALNSLEKNYSASPRAGLVW